MDARCCGHSALGAGGLRLLVFLLLPLGCYGERLVVDTAPPDTTAPRLYAIAPLDTRYDLDGDKLVDVRLIWTDAGRVNPASARVRSLRPLNGPADTTTNLLDVWRVTQRDSVGLWVHESLANLLRDEDNALEVSVADSAGNRVTDTLRFRLPPGAFLTTIETGVASGISSYDIVIDGAGRRGYLTAGFDLVVFDPESLRVVARIQALDELKGLALDEARGLLYVAGGRVLTFDVRTSTFTSEVDGSYSTMGLAQSHADSRTLYAGEDSGYLGFLDVVANRRVDGMYVPHPDVTYEYIPELAVLSDDSKLYAARYNEGGVVVVDPRTRQILREIQVPNTNGWASGSFALTRDERHLYFTIEAGHAGVGALDTSTDSVVRTIDFTGHVLNCIGLSPSQDRIFLTTAGTGPSYTPENLLIDLRRPSVLQTFSQAVPPGTIRIEGPVAFRPDGKLIFVGRNVLIDVYLNRESKP